MPQIFVDFPEPDQPAPVSVSGQSADGISFDSEGFVIPVVIPASDSQAWLDLYDPSNQYSPSAADSRVIARLVLDALAALKSP